jgi:hypothetical protein
MKHFERHPIMQIFARVDFITQVNALLIAGIEYRQPTSGQLVESRFD